VNPGTPDAIHSEALTSRRSRCTCAPVALHSKALSGRRKKIFYYIESRNSLPGITSGEFINSSSKKIIAAKFN
jgi:hypothetical protein